MVGFSVLALRLKVGGRRFPPCVCFSQQSDISKFTRVEQFHLHFCYAIAFEAETVAVVCSSLAVKQAPERAIQIGKVTEQQDPLPCPETSTVCLATMLEREVINRYKRDALSIYSETRNESYTCNDNMPKVARLSMLSTMEMHDRNMCQLAQQPKPLAIH